MENLSNNNFNEVSLACADVAPQWEELAKHLDVDRPTVEGIQKRNGTLKQCLDDVLTHWLKQSLNPTWRKLCNAVANIDKQLSIKIWTDHNSVQGRTTSHAKQKAKQLSDLFDELLDITSAEIKHVDVHNLRLHISKFFKKEEELNDQIETQLAGIERYSTPEAVLNHFVRHNFIGYINYSLIKVFQDRAKSPLLNKCVNKYEENYQSFLKLSLSQIHVVFQQFPDLEPKYPAGIPNFTIHLQSEWDGKSMLDLKDYLKELFGADKECIDQLIMVKITRNCIIITYAVLPHIARKVIEYLTNDDVIMSMKEEGISVTISKQLMKYMYKANEYNINAGKCLIIDNAKFTGGLKSLPEGETADQERLRLLFTGLEFDVESYTNLTVTDMFQVAREYGKMKHIGVFVFIVLSQEVPIHVSTLIECFNPYKCPSLAGVPKIFIINGYTGGDSLTDASIHDDTVLITICSPCTCTSMGMYERKVTQHLIATIDEANERDDFSTILEKLERKKYDQQCVTVEDTLRKKYCIKRNTVISDAQRYYKSFNVTIQIWQEIRQKTIDLCDRLIQQLIDHHKASRTRKTGGILAGVGGGAMALGATLATGGLAFPLLVAGIGLGIAGGATVVGVGFSDTRIQNEKATEIMLQYNKDQNKLKEAIENAKQAKRKFEGIMKNGNVDVNVKLADDFIKTTCAASIKNGSRGADIAGLGVASLPWQAIMLPVNVYEMVMNGMKDVLHVSDVNEAMKELKKFQADLIAQKNEIKSLLYEKQYIYI